MAPPSHYGLYSKARKALRVGRRAGATGRWAAMSALWTIIAVLDSVATTIGYRGEGDGKITYWHLSSPEQVTTVTFNSAGAVKCAEGPELGRLGYRAHGKSIKITADICALAEGTALDTREACPVDMGEMNGPRMENYEFQAVHELVGFQAEYERLITKLATEPPACERVVRVGTFSFTMKSPVKALRVECPTCKRDPGQACRTDEGMLSKPHRTRVESAENWAAPASKGQGR